MLVEIFCEVDDFCKLLEKENVKLPGKDKKSGRPTNLTPTEIATICVWFHYSQIKSFKEFYNVMVRGYEKSSFNRLVSYNRFIELREDYALLLLFFVQSKGLGDCNGISIIDSTSMEVSHIRRANSHKLFKGLAAKGKTSTGWFYGFKLHCIINSVGEIISFFITPGNVADGDENVLNVLTKDVIGKLIADRAYIGKFRMMYEKGITLIHGIRKNMKNKLMDPFDKWLLSRRGAIESVFSILKEWLGLESSKNRSKLGYFAQIFSALAAYSFRPKKPHIFPAISMTIPAF